MQNASEDGVGAWHYLPRAVPGELGLGGTGGLPCTPRELEAFTLLGHMSQGLGSGSRGQAGVNWSFQVLSMRGLGKR